MGVRRSEEEARAPGSTAEAQVHLLPPPVLATVVLADSLYSLGHYLYGLLDSLWASFNTVVECIYPKAEF